MSWQEKMHMSYGNKSKHFSVKNKNKKQRSYPRGAVIDFPRKFYILAEPTIIAIFIYMMICILAKILIK